MNEHRGALVANRDIVDQVPFVQGQTTGALVPQNMGQALELAKIMAGGNVGVPKHLRGQPAVCMRVITDALQFALNPFHLASDSYVVNDQLAYGAKSIHAMTMRSGMVEGRLDVSYEGQGPNMVCRVSGRLRGSRKVNVKTVRLSQITTMNSPLWKSDPEQQLGYYTERAWCRLYAPDAVMGLVAREDPMIDVTPEVVSVNGDAPRGALAEVEAHLGVGDEPDEPEDDESTETPSAEEATGSEGPGGGEGTPNDPSVGSPNGGQRERAYVIDGRAILYDGAGKELGSYKTAGRYFDAVKAQIPKEDDPHDFLNANEQGANHFVTQDGKWMDAWNACHEAAREAEVAQARMV